MSHSQTMSFLLVSGESSEIHSWMLKTTRCLNSARSLTLMFFFSSDPSVSRNASLPSVPSTRRKQLVVWPMPDGKTLSHSMALITELLPLLVLCVQNKTGAFQTWAKNSTRYSDNFSPRNGNQYAEHSSTQKLNTNRNIAHLRCAQGGWLFNT